jgi:hypothetical protein
VTNYEVERWRMRAAEALATAEQKSNPQIKATMLAIAAGYQRMVEQAEAEMAKASPPRPKR